MGSIVDLSEPVALVVTVIVLSLVFGLEALLGGNILEYVIVTAAVTLAVIPHELAHRWCARVMGSYSRYVLSPIGLVLTLITAIPWLPFKIIMPGFTLVSPHRYDPLYLKRLMGLTSYVGPLINIVVASISLVSALLILKAGIVAPVMLFLLLFFSVSARINAWLAFFNLLPVPPLDGSKIISWKPAMWITSLILSIGLYIVSIAYIPF
ncbi:MAG: site-2 protease family protein [Thermoprotei archaeon]